MVLQSSSDLATQINTCLSDAAATYTITFDAKPPTQAPEYHALQIKTDISGVVVRTTAGY
jgi:hypothetical protein